MTAADEWATTVRLDCLDQAVRAFESAPLYLSDGGPKSPQQVARDVLAMAESFAAFVLRGEVAS